MLKVHPLRREQNLPTAGGCSRRQEPRLGSEVRGIKVKLRSSPHLIPDGLHGLRSSLETSFTAPTAWLSGLAVNRKSKPKGRWFDSQSRHVSGTSRACVGG